MSNVVLGVANKVGMEYGLFSILEAMELPTTVETIGVVRNKVKMVLDSCGIDYEEETSEDLVSMFLNVMCADPENSSIAESLGGQKITLSEEKSQELVIEIHALTLALVKTFFEEEDFEEEKKTKALTKRVIHIMLKYGNIQLS